MKKILKLPTILGLLILVVGVVAGIFLINSTSVFKLGAQQEAAPKNFRVSNITSTSITINWTTDIEAKGLVKWGQSESLLSKATLEEYSQPGFVHSTTINGLNPNSQVFLKINSNGTDWDNDGIAWQAKTLASESISSQTFNATGSIVDEVGNPPKGALVFVQAEGSTFSTITSANGSWVINLSSYLSQISDDTLLEISVNAGPQGSATAMIFASAAKNTPLIVLGKSYDFRTLEVNAAGVTPEGTLSVPESIQASSRFEVGGSSDITQNKNVTLDSHTEGEIITTTDPEFFGNAPKGTQIEILVESEAQTGVATAATNGKWKWSPPNNLGVGEHKVTVKWRDDNGIVRTITKTFIVSAAEGPAFEASSSGTTTTPSPTAQPTSSATPKATATAQSLETTPSAIATETALPDTGTLTPTLVLFIMGILVLMTSVFVWNKADA